MKTLLKKQLKTLIPILVLIPSTSQANNLSIDNVTLVDTGGGEADIQFSLSWDNSWHESWTESGGTISVTNWDAVWIFAKYRQNGGLWKHVHFTAAGHTPTGGTAIDIPHDGDGARPGAFVRRNTSGSGTVTCTNMKLHVDLAAGGIPSPDDLDIKVMGVEMVYIPEGAFYLGSGGSEAGHFYAAPDTSAPFLVSSEDEITIGNEAGNLNATNDLASAPIPASYPKGYRAFYCMKYEVTEGQYVDFLNSLDPGIATPYFPNVGGGNRNTLELVDGIYQSSAPDRACGYIGGVSRTLTYLDWAGLRPMTELEFEKACRGPKQAWINEYPWGNTTLVSLNGQDGIDGSGTETALPAGANALIDRTFASRGPVRAGIFATGATTREQAGAGYYGVMNLGGNVREFTTTLDHISGFNFTHTHGDGNEYSSYSNLWPREPYNYCARGGSYAINPVFSRTSDRGSADDRVSDADHHGFRGVRTAPTP